MPRLALEIADIFRAYGPTWRSANVGGKASAHPRNSDSRTGDLGELADLKGFRNQVVTSLRLLVHGVSGIDHMA